jgi:DNA-binding GntR family transcriptional regulator
VALTGSTRLVALAESLTSEIRLAMAKVDRIRRDPDEQVNAHAALVELLQTGNVEGAAAELERHLAHAETSMLDALDLT